MKENKELRVINLFGGPGSGKSTTAAGLFNLMKLGGHSVELVTEYAKDLVWEERSNVFKSQDYILAKQNRRLTRLVGKVKFVITDSPLLLSIAYVPAVFPKSFREWCFDLYKSYTNYNVFLNRIKKYNPVGRNEEDAREMDLVIKNLLNELKVPYIIFDGNETANKTIYEFVSLLDTGMWF